jgi:hypothetical protein
MDGSAPLWPNAFLLSFAVTGYHSVQTGEALTPTLSLDYLLLAASIGTEV